MAEPAHYHILRRVRLLRIIVAEHLRSGIEQEQSENAQHPFEALHNGGTGKDEDAAQDECTEDAPEEHLMLVLTLNAKKREEHQKHKEVVHRQRFLYQIARQKLHGFLVRRNGIEQINSSAKQERNAYPYCRHLQGLLDIHLMLSFPAKHFQVGIQHDENKYIKNNPSPKGHSHKSHHFNCFF